MKNDLRPYPEYKDSGLPWLGKVPAHWDMERAKWLYQQMSRPIREQDEVVTCFRDGTVTLRKKRRELGFTNSLKEIGYQGVRKGDLVIHAMDAFAGAVGISDSDGKSTPVYAVCTTKPGIEVDNRYYAYLVREMARSAWILALARGIRERSTDFRFDTFGNQPVPIPPPDEQKAIADYLDANAAKVRRFIRNRRRLIEVLNEQKQAIINRAVTRGLDPNAPLKPSGIDWLGDIPVHWNIWRNKVLFRERIEAGEPDLPLLVVSLRTGVKIGEEVDERGRPKRTIEDRTKYRKALVGDIAYNMMRLWQGAVGAVPVDGLVSPAYVVATPTRVGCPRFFEYLFRTPQYMGAVNRESRGIVSDRNRTYWDNFKQIPSPVPPLEEQQAIVVTIDAETRALQQAIRTSECEIDLICEYRTRLITDVVTGKVDVRGLALSEPLPADEQIDEGIDDEETLGDDEPELVEEAEES